MSDAAPRSPFLRRAALAVAAVIALIVGSSAFERLFAEGLPASMDFAAFWTAGQLGLSGANIYDGAAVRVVQRGLGLNDTAIMMWNPPWALTLVLPLGLVPFRTAYALWLLLNIGLMLASVELLWRGLGGSRSSRAVAYGLMVAFAPTLLLLFSGQLTMFVLFGLAGYISLRNRSPFFAGMLGALTAVKPHILSLFALWLVFDALRCREGRRVLLGGVIALLLLSIPPTVLNPEVWSQYGSVTTGGSSSDHEHVSNWAPPLIGWWLRMSVPGQPFSIQWLPLILGIACFFVWFGRTQREPSIAFLVGFSMLIAPYGVWHHDLVLMLLPILATAVALSRKPDRVAVLFGVALFVVADLVMFTMVVAKSPYEWFVWVVPIVLLGSAATQRLAERGWQPAPQALGA